MIRDMFESVAGTIFAAVCVVVFFVIVGVATDRVFLEPQRQNGYQFKVTQFMADWCSQGEGDPFASGTRTSLLALRESEPARFAALDGRVARRINAAVAGDRISACN